jgi:hypothetical protein
MSVGDEAGGEAEEGFVDVVPPFPAEDARTGRTPQVGSTVDPATAEQAGQEPSGLR